jgi:spore coat-associated protein N
MPAMSRSARRFVAAVAGLVAVAGAATGAYAVDVSTQTAAQTVQSGTVTVGLGAAGGPSNRLSVAVSGLDPTVTPTATRTVDLLNTGSEALSGVTLSVTATTSTALDSDPVNGVQLAISACSVAWTESGTSPNFSDSCSGSTSTVLAAGPVVRSSATLSNLTSLAVGGTAHLELQLTLPATSPSSDQGLTSSLQLTFTGTQRAGTSE